MSRSVSVATLRRMKREGQPIVALTAYDYALARAVDEAGVDVVLVGDSLGMVIQGHAGTVPVTLEEMAYHTRCVARGLDRALLMTDLPFLSDFDARSALESASVLMKSGGAQMVKIEATAEQAPIVAALSRAGVPVCAHFGLRPQRVLQMGGYRVQGRGEDGAEAVLADARALADAGADVLLVECLPANLAARIQAEVDVPLIGIGAGPGCDGQILVIQDMLGITPGQAPRFSHDFLADTGSIQSALSAYAEAVRSGQFPAREHCFD
ncbi:3-methyl-2-oxobutanoate hydroxymethyltransferase [Spiribacter sp. 2438]|uniref:3-methyl-2-oxobutanoate hydroxymethyltransferase n=1 Tax=Spiribacter sp. 2438 TaxID=2666185 RepID=UPI0012B0E9D7|nr:3-methyl-2-oxobutanoate hydroxymethyltransferase [Spiribacter sp. 2438]QGM21275.1 3-methyl-2-oxobutanoate hydroxymethyltransferase [Spiribacter sp. 2438]